MTETQIDTKVEKTLLPTANILLGGLAGWISYLLLGGFMVNLMGTLVLIIVLVALYHLPPVQNLLRKGLRKLVKRVNK